MNKREKTLAGLTAALVIVLLVFMGVNNLIVKPLRDMDADAAKLSAEIVKYKQENKAAGSLEGRLRELVQWSYGSDELKAGEELRARLVTLMDQAGLPGDNRLLQPVTGHALTGTYREIGRRVQARGKLNDVVDLLYLLNADPHLHRLDFLSVTPAPGGVVDLQLTYSTLVLAESLLPPKSAAVTPASQPAPDLNQGERALYNAIAARDLLRPYIQRVELPPPPPPAVAAAERVERKDPPPPPPPPPVRSESSEGRYRLVLMPMAPGEPLSVLDQATRQTYSYNIGQFLGGGKIVMIDYRPMPLSDDPERISPSRMILQIGPTYWAVEYGQSLSARRQLGRDELPECLRSAPAPATQPATQPTTRPA